MRVDDWYVFKFFQIHTMGRCQICMEHHFRGHFWTADVCETKTKIKIKSIFENIDIIY